MAAPSSNHCGTSGCDKIPKDSCRYCRTCDQRIKRSLTQCKDGERCHSRPRCGYLHPDATASASRRPPVSLGVAAAASRPPFSGLPGHIAAPVSDGDLTSTVTMLTRYNTVLEQRIKELTATMNEGDAFSRKRAEAQHYKIGDLTRANEDLVRRNEDLERRKEDLEYELCCTKDNRDKFEVRYQQSQLAIQSMGRQMMDAAEEATERAAVAAAKAAAAANAAAAAAEATEATNSALSAATIMDALKGRLKIEKFGILPCIVCLNVESPVIIRRAACSETCCRLAPICMFCMLKCTVCPYCRQGADDVPIAPHVPVEGENAAAIAEASIV
jgi:chaperonin cofactor prefoldin